MINVLVSSFDFIWLPMLWVYSHCKLVNSFTAVTVFRRQNLTSIDVRFWRIKSVPVLKVLRHAGKQPASKTRNILCQKCTSGCQYDGGVIVVPCQAIVVDQLSIAARNGTPQPQHIVYNYKLNAGPHSDALAWCWRLHFPRFPFGSVQTSWKRQPNVRLALTQHLRLKPSIKPTPTSRHLVFFRVAWYWERGKLEYPQQLQQYLAC